MHYRHRAMATHRDVESAVHTITTLPGTEVIRAAYDGVDFLAALKREPPH
jgi:hypothetical protein